MRKDPGSSTQWLYKTFAYGPAATTAATTQGRCSCIGESADAPVKPTTTTTTTTTTFTCKSTESQQAPPSTVLPPIPAEVTRSHVAAIIAELQHRKGMVPPCSRDGRPNFVRRHVPCGGRPVASFSACALRFLTFREQRAVHPRI
ncbi:hypothetical protein Vretifemale_15315 [Volvox reticuliferus]|uniref:Uncharacterized protein n=1 Tax=Volvox reticuliferus TaxID=1737510 RepID=A0A8J4CP71_9CHLO|nr:hypothetical protein Vretifemale_15315 [Volvox reticuliferus]